MEDNEEPPAFAGDSETANLIPGVTDKKVKLNIISKPPEKSPYTKNFNVNNLYHCVTLLKRIVEKFKILPKFAPAKKGDEKKKSEEKKISMGKGYFSLEEASFNDLTVFTIVCAFNQSIF